MDPNKVQEAESSWESFAKEVFAALAIETITMDGDYDRLTAEVDPVTFSQLVRGGTVTLDLVRFDLGGGGVLKASTIHDMVRVVVLTRVTPSSMGGTSIKVGP